MTHHKLSGKKLLSHAETEKVNNNSRINSRVSPPKLVFDGFHE
ncbi:unnamed protein product [Brassica oleracea]